ncbi:MAG: hemerythrin domain-containing protein, partial [Pusillimonas sp.]
MAYFEWAKDMEIDKGPIDADHRKLVDLVNELHTATVQGKGKLVAGRLLERLIRDTDEHLREEERI